jgi:hypothetical protein
MKSKGEENLPLNKVEVEGNVLKYILKKNTQYEFHRKTIVVDCAI